MLATQCWNPSTTKIKIGRYKANILLIRSLADKDIHMAKATITLQKKPLMIISILLKTNLLFVI